MIWGNQAASERPTYTSDGSVWKNYRAVWQMNQLTDSLVKDAANGYHGEAHFSSNQEVSGVVGDAFSVSSQDDFIELPNSAYFPEGTEQATLSFWSYIFSDELSDRTLFHASSAQGTHLKVQLPAGWSLALDNRWWW